MKNILLAVIVLMFSTTCVFAFEAEPEMRLTDNELLNVPTALMDTNLKYSNDENNTGLKAINIFTKNNASLLEKMQKNVKEYDQEGGFGAMDEPIQLSNTRDIEYEYLLTAGSQPNTTNMLIYKVDDNYCQGTHPYPKTDPIDGLLMYTTWIYEETLKVNDIPFNYIAHPSVGNTTIQPSMWTEVAVDEVIPDIMKFFKFTNVKPYAMDNNHLYRNNGLYPDNMVMSEWASETEYKVENIGCHLVLNTQGGEFITGNPFVWLIMMDVKDNGDDMFFGSNVKQNVFNSDSYSKPVWTLFFDQKEITHYIHKIRKINNSDVFKNLVENWLYFTVQDNGLTSIDVFNPVGTDN